MRRRAGNYGFTLTELMITLAVVAVLAVIATPSFTDYFERYRLRSAADDAINLLALARQGAVETDRDVNITVAGSTSTWCVGAKQAAEPAEYAQVGAATACDCSSAPTSCVVAGEKLVTDGSNRPGVTVSAVGTTLTYDSKGGTLEDITAATPSITFLSKTQRYSLQVQVNTLGQARACVPAGKRYIPGYQPC